MRGGEFVTVRTGPAIITGHQDPHFDDAGSCICSCSECATEDVRTALFVGGECICPACPCNQEPS